jgi:valyl-tRNA synthetase
MKKFVAKNPQVLDAVMNDEIKFHPANMKNTYKHWIDNIKDWCISRQLWWGQRIPAWYDEAGNFVVAITHDEALAHYRIQYPTSNTQQLKQDDDVVDTWFSSWLWPISVFDGFEKMDNGKVSKENADIKYYYPTNDLVTAPEIMFFWVARMIMAGYEWMDEKPFKNVYYTGIVRDKQRRKMSKSLGNSPDPLDLIAQHGAVSEEVAAAMAQGALANSNAQIALSTTGIAGPTGAVPGKPVGTVCFAWATAHHVETERCVFSGDRHAVREQTTLHALKKLCHLLEQA